MTQKTSITAIICIIFLAACSVTNPTTKTQPLASKEPVIIGALFPLTGGLSQYGEAASHAAQLAAQDINARGGINGQPLQIDVQDHKCDAKEAVSVFTQLAETKNIKIFTSAACSGTVLAIAPLLEAKQALLLGTITTTPKITGVSPFVFRNWASDGLEAKLFAAEIQKQGYKTVSVINEETDYAQGLRLSLEKNLPPSVEVSFESFPSSATDVRTQLTKLQSKNADVLFISPQTVTSAELVLKEMQELKYKPKTLFVNDNVLKASALTQKHKDLLEGALSGDYVFTRTEPMNAMLQTYNQTFGSPCAQTNICAGVYDAIEMLASAMKSKGTDAKSVQAYLQTASYDGLSGTIAFDNKNDRANAGYSLFVIRNGTATLK